MKGRLHFRILAGEEIRKKLQDKYVNIIPETE